MSLFETAPTGLASQDIAVLNLLCAPGLPGSEGLDIPKCVARIDRLAAFVKSGIERTRHRFAADPDYGHCEPMWRMAHLVTMVKRDFGAAYNPSLRDEPAGGSAGLASSADLFIHGLLGDDRDRRWGTCASIPVLVTAVARRLGYPVALATAARHVYARWHGDGACFNIEASGPTGMTVPSDDEHRRKIKANELVPGEADSSYYIRALTPAEEFALFMKTRVEWLIDAGRAEDVLLWSARALQFAPDDPRFPYVAHHGLNLALTRRLRRIHTEAEVPPPGESATFSFNVGDLLSVGERSLHLTIMAHYHEATGRVFEARRHYEDACRHNLHGNNERRDLQRFLRRHGANWGCSSRPVADRRATLAIFMLVL